jgi:probable rRNA maturation factor
MRCNIQLADDLSLEENMSAEALLRLETVAVATLQRLDFTPEIGLSIYVASDAYVRQLNRRYRGVDAPTDVLSFAAEPLPREVASQEAPYAGDIILAYSHTLQQAQQAGHRPDDEFALLIVHGILHLAGYDHDTPASQARMWAKQAEVLATLGIGLTVPDFVHSGDEKNVDS